MHIMRVRIDGFRRLTEFDLELDPKLNVIVGDNEAGKSSVLEAINLVLSRQLDARSIEYALDPYLFNNDRVANYIRAIRSGQTSAPPEIRIEAYLNDDRSEPMLGRLKGTNNSTGENCPGLCLTIVPDSDYIDLLKEYVRDESNPELIPVEYYKVRWLSFSGETMTFRAVPFRATMIDTSLAPGYRGPNRYVAQIVTNILGTDQRSQLSLAYKRLRHAFTKESGVAAINNHLEQQGNIATRKRLSVQMDMSSRSAWDSAITAHLDDLPFDCIGKGEQCRVQMRLAIASAATSRVLLIEEPENHLSHSNLNMLMDEIGQQSKGQQVIITTHSAFVLNKLGLDSLKLMSSSGNTGTLSDLKPETRDYFMKLPGYDTLRMILAKRSILVEGPSDELIVHRAYKDRHGKLPLEDGVDVISVGSLAFKRFLEIATLLELDVCVVTDNDGDVPALQAKYSEYMSSGGAPANNASTTTVRICYDCDQECRTLEPQLLKANTLAHLNKILGQGFACDEDLLVYMSRNKTDCALRLFEARETWVTPRYIADAIR